MAETAALHEDDLWYVIRAYFHKHGVVRHQIESFNNFMTTLLPHILQESQDVRLETPTHSHTIGFCNVCIEKPEVEEVDGFFRPLLPHMARLRSLTYSNVVYVDIFHDCILKETGKLERMIYRHVQLCQIPAMVGSNYCHITDTDRYDECRLDQFGYFVINGVEKAILSQEKLHHNQCYVFTLRGHIKYKLVAEIRSCAETKYRSTSTLYIYISPRKKGTVPDISVSLPFIDVNVPLMTLFILLQVTTCADVMALTTGGAHNQAGRLLLSILENDARADMTLNEVLDWLGREGTNEVTKERRLKYLEHIVTNECLPHIGLTSDPEVMRAKASYVAFMVRKLLNVYCGHLDPDDRDHMQNKRLDTAGNLCSLLFRQVYRAQFKSFASSLQKLCDAGKLQHANIPEYMNDKKISGAMKYAFSTGNWGTQRGSGQTGVVQPINRMTPPAKESNLRRINTPINRDGKARALLLRPGLAETDAARTAAGAEAKAVARFQLGIGCADSSGTFLPPSTERLSVCLAVCPVETPEGGSCGLIKNLAMMAHCRIGTHSDTLKREILAMECDDLLPESKCTGDLRVNGIPVFVNGYLLMYCRNETKAREVCRTLREYRRSCTIAFDTSISTTSMCINVESDSGCLMRPLLIAEKLPGIVAVLRETQFELLWDTLLHNGYVEYIDKQEEAGLRVGIDALCPGDFTHYEIHASMINGMCASLIPFADHDQAPRVVYQSAMGKQAVGISSLNYPRRMDSISYTLTYPQKALVSTKMDKILHCGDEAPIGTNVITCIACYTGFNQEDSLILNQSAIERGLFRAVVYKTHRENEKVSGVDHEKFERPDVNNTVGKRSTTYDKIQKNGAPIIGAEVENGDVIIGKTVTCSDVVDGVKTVSTRDRSTVFKCGAGKSIVHKVLLSTTKEGASCMRVQTRETRCPIVGDKLCFTPDHSILTEHGWVRVHEVRAGDLVLCLDPRTSYMAYMPVLETFVYDVDELLYSVDAPGVHLKVTAAHRMWVRHDGWASFALQEARDVDGRTVQYASCCPNGRNDLAADVQVDTSLLGVLGICLYHKYHSEVTCDMGQVTVVSGTTTPLGSLARLESELERRDVPYSTKVGESATVLSFFEPTVASLCVADVRSWALQLDVHRSYELLSAFCPTSCFWTHSMECRDDIMTLAIHAGISARTRVKRVRMCRLWCVYIVRAEQDNYPIVNNFKGTKESWEHYKGTVHCVRVPTKVCMVRRKGCSVWSGNSSRHGQKGVVGQALPASDMPFTKDGIVPDVIINPHAIPSRMTIGHLMECLLGKLCAHKCQFGDGTPFQKTSLEYISKLMEENGQDPMGNEDLYNGMSGERFQCKVFIGPTYYQRLKHMVMEKYHSRSRGPVVMLTRQPVEGRARDGGLRVGEMERDCLVAHGAANVLCERLFEQSDPFCVHICADCGFLANPPSHTRIVRPTNKCKNCDSANIKEVKTPYAFKLFVQELAALNISVNMDLLEEDAGGSPSTDYHTVEPTNFLPGGESSAHVA